MQNRINYEIFAEKIVSWQNIEFLNYFLGFLTRKVITRKNFDRPLLLITDDPWKSNDFSCTVLGKRQEIHVTFGQFETPRHGGRVHVQKIHVCHLQPRGAQCLQGELKCYPCTTLFLLTNRGINSRGFHTLKMYWVFVSFRTGRLLSCLVRLRTTLTRGKRLSSGRAFTQRRAAKPWTVTR